MPSTSEQALLTGPVVPTTVAPEAVSWRRRLKRTGRPVVRALRPLLLTALRASHRLPHGPPSPDQQHRIRILLFHAYGSGGTTRTVFTVAERLARDFDVEIVSLFRNEEESFYPLPTGVRLRVLVDARPGVAGLGQRWLTRIPSLLWHDAEGGYGLVHLWSDVCLVRWLLDQRSGVVVTTRLATNILLAQLRAPTVQAMGQQHVDAWHQRPELLRTMLATYGGLDVLVVLTKKDEQQFREHIPGSSPQIVRISNAVRPLSGGLADPDAKVVIAFGEFRTAKGFDLLVRAWHDVAPAHPGWRLRILGDGLERPAVTELVHDLGLQDSVELPGPSKDIGAELARSSVFVLSSRSEGFPLALIEAMSKGVAVVSFDCPQGPGELLTHGHDGLLVPPEDVAGLAAELTRVLQDSNLRRTMQANAVVTARRFDLDVISTAWSQLFAQLLEPDAGAECDIPQPRSARDVGEPAPARAASPS